MPNHAEDLGRTLLEQRGSLTAAICQKAVDEAAAKIERDKALRGIDGLISDLRTFLMRNQSDPEKCLAEMRRVLLKSTEILRPSGDAPKNPTPPNGDKAKAKTPDANIRPLQGGKPS